MKASDLINSSKIMQELCEQPREKFTGRVRDYAFLWAGQSFEPTEDEKLKWESYDREMYPAVTFDPSLSFAKGICSD
jgi:hypothetical protein